MRPEQGRVLGGRYRLTERVAVGGMGEVWQARDDVLARTVAVKVLKEEYATDPGFLERFRAEARHSAALAHPNVAGVYDYGEADSSPYLVMELVPGEPFSDTLAREGALPVEQVAPVLAQAAEGLAAAHAAGLVHRDVKPGNLLVTPDGRVKVTDFGIARAGDQVPMTRTGQVMGTAQYLAPEQAMGRAATPASDVYALGVVGYEALAGRRPFVADSQVALAMAHVNEDPPALPADVPAGARALVERSMAKDPQDRPADASTFAAAAHALARGDEAAALAVLGVAGAASTAAMDATAPMAPDDEATRAMAADARDDATVVGVPPVGAADTPEAWDDEPTDDRAAAPAADPTDAGRRRRRFPVWLALLLVLLVVGVLAWLFADGLFGGEPDPGTTTPPPAQETTEAPAPTDEAPEQTEPPQTQEPDPEPTQQPDPEPEPETIDLDPSAYVGRDRGAVAAELGGLGLQVAQQADTASQEAAGTVLSLSPTSGLTAGDTVTLVYAEPPPETEEPGDEPTTPADGGTGGGTGGTGDQGDDA